MTIFQGDKSIAEYHERGLLRITLPEPVLNQCKTFLAEAATWLKEMGGITVDPAKLSESLPAIAAKDRTLIARLYKVSRRFPSAKRIASESTLADISAKLMGVSLSSCCHFVNVRIDLPGED